MSPLEAAQRLRDRAVMTHEVMGRRGTACHLCSWARIYWEDQPVAHSPDCPVPALPQVVAALEAAERVVTHVQKRNGYDDQHGLVDYEILEALDAALKGDVPS